jgi:hypothetical protein
MDFIEIPDNIKFRLLLSFEENKHRKFYWFEMKDDEFYWGSSYKVSRMEIPQADIKGKQITITVPDNYNNLPKISGKYSYHKSGKKHYKLHMPDNTTQNIEEAIWKVKEGIVKPTTVLAI